jgi:hypothetical protein
MGSFDCGNYYGKRRNAVWRPSVRYFDIGVENGYNLLKWHR